MIRKQEIRKILISFLNISLCFISILLSFLISYLLFVVLNKSAIKYPLYDLELFNFIKQMMLVLLLWGALFVESGIFTEVKLTSLDKFIIIFRDTVVGMWILLAINFLYPDFLFSPYFIFFTWIISIVFIYFTTVLVSFIKRLYRRMNINKRKILLIGKNKISKFIKKKNQKNYRGRYYFYPYSDNDISNLSNYLKEKSITELIITNKFLHEDLLAVSDICDELGVNVKFCPTMLEIRMGEITIDDDFGIPLLQIKPVSFLDKNFINKRIFDVFFAISAFALAMFPILFVVLLVKMTSAGNIFYKQKRVGLKGRLFDFYKFRTMIPNADQLLEKILHLNERQGPVFKIKKDPRLTFIGSFLRRFSIDEIPQFYNVLKGDMSIVGPRPPLPKEVEAFSDLAKRRFKVFPGITGIWQISGRSDLSFDEMINLDIYYLENWALSMDLEIILKTIPAVLTSKGAC